MQALPATRFSGAPKVPPAARRRRRVFPLVDSRFQWKYALSFAGLAAGIGGAMAALLYAAHVQNTRLLNLIGNERLHHELLRGDRAFVLAMVAALGCVTLLAGLWGLIATHRISGPLLIVGRYLNELGRGCIPIVRPLRRRDELQGLCKRFQTAMNALRRGHFEQLTALDRAIAEAHNHAEMGCYEQGLSAALVALQRQRELIAGRLGRLVVIESASDEEHAH